MRVRWRLATLVLVVAGVGAGAAPSCVLACWCAQPPSLKVAVDERGSAVFVGRAIARTGDAVTFGVERWYAGPGAAPIIQVMVGQGGTCGLDVQAGDHLVLTASRDENGRFNPSICSPYARVGSPEANALLAEAEATFGPGRAFVDDPDPAPAPAGPSWVPLAAIGAAGATLGALALAAIVLLLRRRDGPGAA